MSEEWKTGSSEKMAQLKGTFKYERASTPALRYQGKLVRSKNTLKPCHTVRMTGKPNPASNIRVKLDQNLATFLKTDLALCETFVDLALTRLKTGNLRYAEQAITNAEKGYTTLSQLLSDPKHVSHLTAVQIQEFTAELQRLRERLDGYRSEHY